MSSMYERLMELPLFKGMSINDLSLLLEKTPLEFDQLPPGSSILRAGEEYDRVCFLLSGEANAHYQLFNGQLTLIQRVAGGMVLCADRLMGLNTEVPCDVVAHSTVGVMFISKKHYLALLEMNRIFLVNYLNYISFKSQMRMDSIRWFSFGSLDEFCRYSWRTAGERRVVSTTWRMHPDFLLRVTGLTKEELEAQISQTAEKENVDVSYLGENLCITYTGHRPD